MGLEIADSNVRDVDELVSIQKHHLTMPKQQHIEDWFDGPELESLCKRFSVFFE